MAVPQLQHVSTSDLTHDKFTGLDDDSNANEFIDMLNTKILFALGPNLAVGAGITADHVAAFDNRKKALLKSLLRGPALEWFNQQPVADDCTTITNNFREDLQMIPVDRNIA